MPQINATLDEGLIKELQKIAHDNGKSFSKTVSNIIELGIKIYNVNEDPKEKLRRQKQQELENLHSEFLLRILGITSEIVRKLYGSDSQYNADNAEDLLDTIKLNMKQYIRSYIEDDPNI